MRARDASRARPAVPALQEEGSITIVIAVINIITIALAFDLSIYGIASALRINIIASGLPTCVYFSTCVFALIVHVILSLIHFAPVLIVYVILFLILFLVHFAPELIVYVIIFLIQKRDWCFEPMQHEEG